MQRVRGPIVVIEDDRDDQELLEETFKVLNYPNEVIFFRTALRRWHTLKTLISNLS